MTILSTKKYSTRSLLSLESKRSSFDSIIQPKLKIGQPGDKYEQEADRVADAVMRMPALPVQMQSMEEEEEKKLQMQPLEEEEELQMMPETPEQIQKMCPRCRERAIQGKPLDCPECEKKLQMMLAVQQQSDGQPYASSEVSSQLQTSKGQGSWLAPGVQQEMAQKMGGDFREVKVHTDSKSHELNRRLGARAFTHGRDIYFNRGEYQPDSSKGKHLLAHELVHTVQQGNETPLVQRALHNCEVDEGCPERESDEHAWARSDGIHTAYIDTPEAGFLVWGFPIDSAEITGIDSTSHWGPFWADMMSRDALWKVRGFTDCPGDATLNSNLRQRRSLNARNELPAYARDKVVAFWGAPLTDCIAGNTTKEERAYNRSAFFQIMQENIEFEEGEEVTGHVDIYICAKDLDTSPVGNHAFFRIGGTSTGLPTYSLQPEDMGSDCWQGIPGNNYPSDVNTEADCVRTPITLDCLKREFRAYPVGHYCTLGPNSNTFVSYIAGRCMTSPMPPRSNVPGWASSPPPSGTFAPGRYSTLVVGCTTKECAGVTNGSALEQTAHENE